MLPRSTLVSLSDTPFYHCVSRCVRRTYVCGCDSATQKSHEHRRHWLEYKLLNTAEVFAIKLWRERLTDISWFMRIINEAIARQANHEDRSEYIARAMARMVNSQNDIPPP